MVAVLHLSTTGLFSETVSNAWLRGGVDIFFVISGFIMVKSTDGRSYSPGQFYLKRIIRIVPIYWIATLAFALSHGWTGWHGFASLFFIPAAHPQTGSFLPLLEPGWTLNYEMFFYLIFGAFLIVPAKFRLALTCFTLASFVIVGQVYRPGGAVSFFASSIILEFALGMALAKTRITLPLIAVPAGFAMMPLLYGLTDYRLLSLGIPAAIIVWGLVSSESRIPHVPILKSIGDASYSIYLFHLMFLGSAANVWILFFPMSVWFAPFAMLVLIGSGIVFHRHLELPVTRILSDSLGPKRNGQMMDSSLVAGKF